MDKDRLKFREDGTFTIVQFTDLHWKNGEIEDLHTYALMKQILEQEAPDLIIFTGDIIHSEKSYHPKEAFLEAVKVAEQFQLPWAAVFGNHDAEDGVTRKELMQLVAESEYGLSDAGMDGIKGVGNYAIPVQSSKHNKTEAVLYCFDSGSNSLEEAEVYEWIDPTQVNWYIKQSTAFTHHNNGSPLPSLAFFHIPLPEYQEMWNYQPCYGHNYEGVGCSLINSGLFSVFLKMKDVMGTFVGHDHVNDYWGDYHGIRLCYGKATGFNGYGKEGFQRGARLIQLQENAKSFDTWLRLEDGSKLVHQPEHLPLDIRGRAHE
ncbi:metallophosphoesterase [Paenibacillus psychroresistens]|uniref:Metallophosphoesterase n=1 Tax=Paenibacillus psychroresistens TaxID=1778678 RepID=A0A6B8RGH6_9BACL|nr:metallophosphoesterase family protein [Paenibacillus psychroresistens]QGQ94824.1 metallophosphoesterase [Paenibacillus psychroresistens]